MAGSERKSRRIRRSWSKKAWYARSLAVSTIQLGPKQSSRLVVDVELEDDQVRVESDVVCLSSAGQGHSASKGVGRLTPQKA